MIILSCKDCGHSLTRAGAEQYPPSAGCPKCGGRHFGARSADNLPPARDEGVLRMRSVVDLAAIDHVVTRASDYSRHETKDDGGLTATRTTRHRDPYAQEKEREEVEAVGVVLRAFNAAFGTDYANPRSELHQNHHVDVWAVDSRGARLGFQVTRPDTRVWQPLAQGRTASSEETEEALHARLVAAVVRSKAHHGDAETVLVLDAWGIVSPVSIERIPARLRTDLANLGFHSVWFCNRRPDATAMRVDA